MAIYEFNFEIVFYQMLKNTLSLPLSWKNLYQLKFNPQNMLNIESHNFTRALISKNQSQKTQEFQRLFTKSIHSDSMPKQDYELICEEGNIAAIHEYADSLIKENPSKAAYCYKIGSEKQDIKCMYDYGICLYLGKGVKKDYSAAFKLFEESSKKGNTDSYFCLYICYLYGHGVQSDKEKAADYFQRLARKDYINSFTPYCISEYFQDYNKQQFFHQAAEQGEKHSEFLYSLSILFGAGHDAQDIEKGLYYLKKSADEGYPPSQERYGEFLLKGYFVESDIKLSMKYLSLAAEKKFFRACYLYSVALMKQKNPDKMLAFKMMKKAADNGHVDAMIELGKMLINGYVKDEEDSLSEGFNYLKKAMEKNYTDALLIYAKLYEENKIMSKTETDYVASCYRRAAVINDDEETTNIYFDFLKRHNRLDEMKKFSSNKYMRNIYEDWDEL